MMMNLIGLKKKELKKMKPYGREKSVKGRSWKKDVHPPKGYINWWEDICDFLSRSAMKQQVKKEINKEINKE